MPDEAAGDGLSEPDSDGEKRGGDSGEQTTATTSPFLFLLGLLGFVASLVAFGADLVTGHDVLRSLLVNAASVVVLVFWAARDTLTDPESSVDSTSGAAGTGFLLLGLYLAIGAAVVGVTSLVHGRFDLVPWAAGLGILLVVVGFVVLPRETILADDSETEPAAGDHEEPDS